jgi:hypothetical protein
MNAPRRNLLALALALVAAASLAWPAAAPAQTTPSLRLVPTGGHVTLPSYRGRVFLELGAWAAATGGDFELRVARADYDSPVDIVQVDSSTGAVIRDLPETTLEGWSGLSRFVGVTVRKPDGTRVARRVLAFCPNTYERQRVDDSGPEVPRYPTSCGAFSPFTRGMVWGIESGWAANVLVGEFESPRVRVPDGRYTVTVRIARRYVDLLEIDPVDSIATFSVTVKAQRFRDGKEGEAWAQERLAQRAAEQFSSAVPEITDPDPETLPDLVALPPWDMTTFQRRGKDYLSFAATPWNEGPAPLLVEGFRRSGEEVMDAYQYFRDADGNVVGRALVGDMKFHPNPAHNHWHFLQFASFTLHDAADMEVVRSRKQAFCLAPTDPIDLTVERASWSPWNGVGTSCGTRSALWVREVLQAGWGDTYFQFVPGQSWNISGLPNGWYYARLEVNPLGALYEADMSNNVESRLLYLGGRPGKRWVVVAPWHGIDA